MKTKEESEERLENIKDEIRESPRKKIMRSEQTEMDILRWVLEI